MAIFTPDNSKKTSNMALVGSSIVIKVSTMVSGIMEKNKAKVCLSIQTKISIQGFG